MPWYQYVAYSLLVTACASTIVILIGLLVRAIYHIPPIYFFCNRWGKRYRRWRVRNSPVNGRDLNKLYDTTDNYF